MNTIKTTTGTATKLTRFLVNDYSWKKLTLTRKEAAYLLNEKQDEAHHADTQLSIVRDSTTGTIYIGKAFDSSAVEEKQFKRVIVKTDKAWKTVIYFQPSGEEFPSMVIEITDKPAPRKPTLVTV
jgi:hypothetical protein